ncbi:MAG TPA: MEDS domain-containing protein [Actinocrinis sp.]|nr:MEDS domain-containing protein [Actinocrinis sp.]
MTTKTDTWSALTPGEHVCWQVSSPEEYVQGRRELMAHTSRVGGRLLILGAPPDGAAMGSAVSVLDPAPDAGSSGSPSGLLRAIGAKAHAARRSGQALRVLAGMEYLLSPEASLEELIMCEMELGELALRGETVLVCAYSQLVWKPTLLRDLAAVHSRVMGSRPRAAGFRLIQAGIDTWSLEGTVGFESRSAFSAALRGTLSRTPHARLRCGQLDLIDASALRTLVETVNEASGASLVLEQANETVLLAWQMSGYAALGAPIEVRQ